MTSADGAPPDVSIVVVNFEGEASVARCLDSLIGEVGPSYEIVVVDNASTDRGPSILEHYVTDHPEIRLILSDINLGYAGGVDLALEECGGRYVAVLNMDVVVESGWLAPLVTYLEEHPNVAAVNPLLALESDGRVNAAGQWIHVSGLGFNRALGEPRSAIGREPFRIAGLQGAAFLMRRSLLDEMGGFDSGGFLYHEDVNLSWLLRLMGHELACVPSSVVRHDYFLSMHPEKLELLERNRAAMLLSYLERSTRWRLWPWRLVSELMLWGYALLRGPAFLRAKWRARRWIHANGELIEQRRALARHLRTRTDREVLRAMSRSYPLRQLFALARERGAPRRPLSS